MKATKIWVKELVNKGNYEHEELGIEIVVEDGENVYEVIQKTREFISELLRMDDTEEELERLKKRLEDENLTIREYKILEEQIKVLTEKRERREQNIYLF